MFVHSLIVLRFFFLASLAAARPNGTCPLESDCIQKLCRDFTYHTVRGTHAGATVMMEARCKNNAGDDIITQLDLRKCIRNFDGMLKWGDNGEFRCGGCKVYQETDRSKGDNIILKCDDCPRRHKGFLGMDSSKWTWLDLSYGIWVKDGVIGCYSHSGSRTETLKTLTSPGGGDEKPASGDKGKPSQEDVDVLPIGKV
ncbi:cvnh domain-containing protein [Colletotrichum sojae]|uniref:Cvnh domain-containing protein n=1 Tax=Colletotrichum sojae TaxID=2175907 RepID=A0A8H6MVC8_9PEZI|nr:cvnh domain-containing protein [Colletotrichum sojae]